MDHGIFVGALTMSCFWYQEMGRNPLLLFFFLVDKNTAHTASIQHYNTGEAVGLVHMYSAVWSVAW